MDVWGDVPTWLTLVGGFVVFLLGRAEYRSTQQWKRSEFLAAEIDKFFAQPRVATALLLIDYSAIRLDGEGHRATTNTADTHVFDDALLISALRVHTSFANETEVFTTEEMLAREAFDELLTGLERFDHHIQAGLIDIEDAKVYLGYWVEKLTNPGSGWKPAEFYNALTQFVRAYGYAGATHLFAAFGRTLAPQTEIQLST